MRILIRNPRILIRSGDSFFPRRCDDSIQLVSHFRCCPLGRNISMQLLIHCLFKIREKSIIFLGLKVNYWFFLRTKIVKYLVFSYKMVKILVLRSKLVVIEVKNYQNFGFQLKSCQFFVICCHKGQKLSFFFICCQ